MATLPVAWFVILMQFLYRYIEDLVGKGLSVSTIAEIIFYAAMSFLPMAMPLGILLAALISFGNMAERLELLSMKASGVALYRIMRPAFLSVVAMAFGLFAFENDFMIKSQVKLWTLIYSARNATPELEIPEGSFYNAIDGYNIYVKKRNKNGLLQDVIVYDYSKGVRNVRIIRADSGRIVMNANKNFVKWKLYNGQSFENIKEDRYGSDPGAISHIKERFKYKEVLISFDAQFKKEDESTMQSMFVGKNLKELDESILTNIVELDSIREQNKNSIITLTHYNHYSSYLPAYTDTSAYAMEKRAELMGENTDKEKSIDTILQKISISDSLRMLNTAVSNLERLSSEINARTFDDERYFYTYRTNLQEWHRKFTFPAACIVFFLIGAPLGAIIRKGGIGLPLIAGIFLFIIYYLIDTFGYKMSNHESIPIWLGSWLSVIFLLPLGISLTMTATKDSAKLNMDAYVSFFKKVLGLNKVRNVEIKDLIIYEAKTEDLLEKIDEFVIRINHITSTYIKSNTLLSIWLNGNKQTEIKKLSIDIEEWINNEAINSTNTLFVAKLKDIPYLPLSVSRLIPSNKTLSRILLIVLPISIPISLFEWKRLKQVKEIYAQSEKALKESKSILSNSNK